MYLNGTLSPQKKKNGPRSLVWRLAEAPSPTSPTACLTPNWAFCNKFDMTVGKKNTSN